MTYRLLPPHVFVSKPATNEGPAASAFEQAAEFLDNLERDGIEPVRLVAKGTAARVTLSGDGEDALLIFRRAGKAKGK